MAWRRFQHVSEPVPQPVITLADADATVALGARVAAALAAQPAQALCITLTGDLGAGKTTLVRGLLRALGHAGNVKSPTYTLVEPYALPVRTLYHLDLYRLADPEELEFLGIRDLGAGNAVLLVEWAERGRGFLPPADLDIALAVAGDGRRAHFSARSARGAAILAALQSAA
jgi:tRNA threonylcarbamoyladenosine biosynthesis protein TsaE